MFQILYDVIYIYLLQIGIYLLLLDRFQNLWMTAAEAYLRVVIWDLCTCTLGVQTWKNTYLWKITIRQTIVKNYLFVIWIKLVGNSRFHTYLLWSKVFNKCCNFWFFLGYLASTSNNNCNIFFLSVRYRCDIKNVCYVGA